MIEMTTSNSTSVNPRRQIAADRQAGRGTMRCISILPPSDGFASKHTNPKRERGRKTNFHVFSSLTLRVCVHDAVF